MVQKDNIGKKILIICGPTASGKTALAVECAKLLDSEVVSADSMYIYKGLNVGTAKPTKEEMQGIPHHLIDVVDSWEEFSVSDYRKTAVPIIENLISKNKIPIICGGTGFYINSILYNLSYGNGNANLAVRNKYKKLAEEKGNEYVFSVLREKDPDTADKLHFNDLKRVIRALEIYETGIKKSEIKDDFTPLYDYSAFCVNHERTALYERINKRVDIMIKNGLLEEVKGLIRQGVSSSCQSMQAIGYKEILEYFDNKSTLDEAIEKIKLNTRHYAKRQNTYFKRMANIEYIEPNDVKIMADRIIKKL